MRRECELNARLVAAYRAAATAQQRVYVYSGYAGPTYKPTATNYPGSVQAAPSVDGSRPRCAPIHASVFAGGVLGGLGAAGGRGTRRGGGGVRARRAEPEHALR